MNPHPSSRMTQLQPPIVHKLPFSNDPRLLPVAYIPLQSLELAAPCASEAIEVGASALLIPNRMFAT